MVTCKKIQLQERKSRITILLNNMFEKLQMGSKTILPIVRFNVTHFVTSLNTGDKIFALDKEGI